MAGDKLSRNAYLTQGLLLVTLGFLTHLAGLKLSLVLGVESVMLLMIGQQLKSRVMQAGSLISAALAVGYAAVTIGPFDRDGVITGSAVGALMLWNAFSLRRETTFEQSPTHLRTAFYTALGLIIWLVTTWQNLAPEWRGLAVAGESVAILLAARPLSNRVLVLGAYAFAGLALELGNDQPRQPVYLRRNFPSHGLASGISHGRCASFQRALWEQRSRAAGQSHNIPSASNFFFSSLALLAWLITTGVFVPREYLAPVLAIEALAF